MTQEITNKIEKLENFIISQMQKANIPGICIGILENGKMIYSNGFGYRNIKQALPMTPQTIYGIGSTSKTFLSLAMMQLAEEEKIDLHAPLKDYLNFELDSEDNPILLHHCLSHSSGIHDLTINLGLFNWVNGSYSFLKPCEDQTSYMRTINQNKPYIKFQPGERFMYNNDLFDAMTFIIENITGMSYQEYVKKRIFDPLEMKRTYFYEKDVVNDPVNDYMVGYGLNPNTKILEEKRFPYGDCLRGAGGIQSNIEDMLRYSQMLLNKGKYNANQILTSEYIKKMWTPVINTKYGFSDEVKYCYGWMYEPNYLEEQIIHHGGNAVVSSNFLAIMPERKLAVVVGQNTDNQMTSLIARAVFAIWLEKSIPQAIPLLGAMQKIGQILGKYTSPDGFVELEVKMENVQPIMKFRTKGFPETVYTIIPKNLDKLLFQIPTIFEPNPLSEVQFFIDQKAHQTYVLYDRYLLFKQ